MKTTHIRPEQTELTTDPSSSSPPTPRTNRNKIDLVLPLVNISIVSPFSLLVPLLQLIYVTSTVSIVERWQPENGARPGPFVKWIHFYRKLKINAPWRPDTDTAWGRPRLDLRGKMERTKRWELASQQRQIAKLKLSYLADVTIQ